MDTGDSNAKLSELQTQTTLLYEAQHGTPEGADLAKQLLMLRYSGAVHRYLLKALGDSEAAKDLNQEFSLKFLEGRFRQFDRTRGRFRDYLKRSLHNLMVDFYRKQNVVSQLDTASGEAIVATDDLVDFDEQFLQSWRKDLMERASNALREHEASTGQPFWEVMRLRLLHPQMRSPELAEQLAQRLGRPMSAGNLRQILHRARDKFTEFLVEEVKVSLKTPSRDEVEEELADLKLLEFCKPSLDRVKFD
ncbi:RNA polymerase sigma factor [Planctomyces sp. SH-PL62]|uniref:RNA polymerase sigma factor n=1 Tax=Planctomyces sp. SH-PL62 TaxID=1636152 RepID=UPI00078E6776|nr:sigma-70 family RNA polymerase sigma factor [Planctomyces sp. SH-PL62]AMV37097.1 RNA polymerase sigma factor [Planctomyces sp. SH-PL62]